MKGRAWRVHYLGALTGAKVGYPRRKSFRAVLLLSLFLLVVHSRPSFIKAVSHDLYSTGGVMEKWRARRSPLSVIIQDECGESGFLVKI